MNDLYPVLMKCDGTCGKQYNLFKMMRRWFEHKDYPGMYQRDHYCMPCWNNKVEEDKDEKKNNN